MLIEICLATYSRHDILHDRKNGMEILQMSSLMTLGMSTTVNFLNLFRRSSKSLERHCLQRQEH